MIDWAEDKDGCIKHPWCGAIIPGAPGEFNKPTCWVWFDRRGIKRASFPTLAEAKRAARKFSGVEVR